jgi:DNA-directed RNA polymerase subunit H (RpoH/RPB5)
MKGGKADKLTLPQIAKKHKLPIEDLTSQLKLGIKTEMEHTDNKKQAREIAMDHLAEDPKYYTKLKKTKLEEAIGKSLTTAALGLSLMGNPSVSKASQGTTIVQQQQKVLTKVSFTRSEPISNPDLDLVHGALGSKRLTDDFEQRVQDELKNQVNNGNIPDVSNIQVKTYIQGNQIVTEASCDIIESQYGIPYTHFTTRGSIGYDYDKRHDEQINGLLDRLENHYGGIAKQVGKTFIITFQVNGKVISYKQSFFVVSDSDEPQTQKPQETQTISGKDFADLRQKLKDQTKDISIDPNSIEINMDNYSISYQLGNKKIKVISLIYDDSGQLENRLITVKNQNPTLEIIEKGKSGNINWVVSIILANLEESLNEVKIPSKLKSDIEIEYHKNLNPKFWLNNHLKSNIRKNLLNLGKYYFNNLQLDPKVKLKDIIFTGSLANYNYTNSSDIDLHIIIDYKDVSDDVDFVMNYFLQKRAAWEVSNDVKIGSYPVEIYVQDINEQTVGKSAMYSILNNKWIKKPKYKLPEVDRHLVTQKVNKYLDIFKKISTMKDSLNKIESYDKVLKKIKKERGEATQTEGEFSVNNLVFKVLRNKKVFDNIKNDKKEIVNNIFSINSN